MTVLSITVNGTALYPSEVSREYHKYGVSSRAINGKLIHTFNSIYSTWTLSWKGLHESKVLELRTLHTTRGPFVLIDENEYSYNVLCLPDAMTTTFSATTISMLTGAIYYDVDLSFEQITPANQSYPGNRYFSVSDGLLILAVTAPGVTPRGIYAYTDDTGWLLKNSGLPAIDPLEVYADYTGTNWMVVLAGNWVTNGTYMKIDGTSSSPLWQTTNSGTTFTEVNIAGYASTWEYMSFQYDIVVANKWSVITKNGTTTRHWFSDARVIFENTLAGPIESQLLGGPDNDVIRTEYPSAPISFVSAISTAYDYSGVLAGNSGRTSARLRGASLQVYSLQNNTLLYTSDYRTNNFTVTPVYATTATAIDANTANLFISGISGSGVIQLSNLGGAVTATLVGPVLNPGEYTGKIRVDMQLDEAIAARIINSSDFIIYDPVQSEWGRLVGPGVSIRNHVDIVNSTGVILS